LEASDQDGRVQRGALVGSATNETNPRLADAWQGLGIACELITPLQVLQRLHDFDKFLARLDVLQTLDGVEPGLPDLLWLERTGRPY
jgi:hypothetical protein